MGGGGRNIKNTLFYIDMSHVAACAHVVMNAEHDRGVGDSESVVWPQYYL